MNQDRILIRRLTPADTKLAAEAIDTLKPAAERAGRKLTEDAIRPFLERAGNVLLVATAGSVPVGFAVGYLLDRVDRDAPMLLLYEIEVAPTRRRRGIGRAIVEELERLATSLGAVKMWVLTDRENAAARALYASCGASLQDTGLLFTWSAKDLSSSVG
jgi:aminoglycoside 6'-N-acetyltransferase I